MRRAIFFAADGKLRAIWRGVLFAVASLVALVVALGITAEFGLAAESGLEQAVESFAQLAAFLAVHAWALRKLDRKNWSFVWLDRSAARMPKLAIGTALGALAVAVPAAVLLTLSYLSIADASGGAWWGGAGLSAAVLLPSAFAEELLARGYIFALLREAAGSKAALAVTSIGFGLLHVWNPGANWQSLSVVVLAGFFLGAIVLVTGSLYAATLAHFAWNWFIAAVLHMPVSGIHVAGSPDYRVVETGPDWLTGGSWGPEGGIGAGLGLCMGLIYLYWRGTRAHSA